MKNIDVKSKRESKKPTKEKEVKVSELVIGNTKRSNHSRPTITSSGSLNTI